MVLSEWQLTKKKIQNQKTNQKTNTTNLKKNPLAQKNHPQKAVLQHCLFSHSLVEPPTLSAENERERGGINV